MEPISPTNKKYTIISGIVALLVITVIVIISLNSRRNNPNIAPKNTLPAITNQTEELKISVPTCSNSETNNKPNNTQKINITALEDLDNLLKNGENLSTSQYLQKEKKLHKEIVDGLDNGSIKMTTLIPTVRNWLAAKNERSVSAGIVLASEIGNEEMVNTMKNLYSNIYASTSIKDSDMRQFILFHASIIRFDRSNSIQNALSWIGKESDPKFREGLVKSVLKVGNCEVVQWLVNNIKQTIGAQRDYWISGFPIMTNPKAFDALITVSKSTNDNKITQMALSGIGGSDQGVDKLLSLITENSNDQEITQIAEALTYTPHDSGWSTIKNELIFGKEVNKRIAAARAFSKNSIQIDRYAIKETFRKLLNQEQETPKKLKNEISSLLRQIE